MKIKLVIMSALMFFSVTSFAQFTKCGHQSSGKTDGGWSSFYIQYNAIGTNYNFKKTKYLNEWNGYGLKDKMSGISIGYSKTSPLSSSSPLFFKYEGGLQYSWYSDSNSSYYNDYHEHVDVKLALLSIKVPVSLAYLYSVPNSEVSFEPYAGIYVRANIYGNVDANEEYGYSKSKDNHSLNILKDKDCNGAAASICQIGWHIGLNVSYTRYFVGISYGSDITKIYDSRYASVKLNTTSITAGIRF